MTPDDHKGPIPSVPLSEEDTQPMYCAMDGCQLRPVGNGTNVCGKHAMQALLEWLSGKTPS